MRQQWADYRVFWREFRRAFHSTGAVLPSGRALAKNLCRYVRQPDAAAVDGEPPGLSRRDKPAGSRGFDTDSGPTAGRRILEVGPGTGAVTGHIIQDLRPDDRLVLVERNEQFVARLRARLANEPGFHRAIGRVTLMHASVEDMAEEPPFDLIISGLPFNNFSTELVEQVLAKLTRLLAPGGTLSFFEYVAVRRAKSLVSSGKERERLRGIGRVLSATLQAHEVNRDLVMANVPPAWVHHVRFA
ncbi:MAG: class I SAM-dependent methyltransferase [Pirellulales bacterium]